jgi:flagellar motor switch/type III secretory pathway protein FliN
LTVGESETLKSDSLPEDFKGPGLAIVFMVGSSGAVLVLPESSSLVPPWCAAPDATGQSKLATLAQELGMNLLPEAFMPDDSKTALIPNITDALQSGGLAENAAAISLNLSTPDGKQGTARLIWPLANPLKVIETVVQPEAAPAPTPAAQPVTPPVADLPKAVPAEQAPQPAQPRSHGRRFVPTYTKSLLKIKVPITVTLAEKKQALSQIVEMGPGMIIQFEKSCEETLQLEVGDRKVACGEAIKVGDKFGIRITEIILPEERFNTVNPRKPYD